MKNIIFIAVFAVCLLQPVFSYGQHADTMVKQIQDDINKQKEFEYERFKFKDIELIYEFEPKDCGSMEDGVLIEKETFNSPEEENIAKFINEQFNKVYPIFKQGQIAGIINDDPEPFYSAGVHTLVVFGFKQDTFVDVVFATGFDVGSYDNHYHCIFTFDEFKFMASFECMYGDTRPFGDFNNDDILDFAVYNWTSDSIFLYTLKDGIFEICTDYKIKLKYDVDLYLPLIDKTSTKINVFIDEQWIAIPSR